MTLLGLDLGTTHCKGAIFDENGAMLASASYATPTVHHQNGWAEHDPEQIWAVTGRIIRSLMGRNTGGEIDAVGVASMAEAGCLVYRRSGAPRTPVIPWYDTRSTPQADRIAAQSDVRRLFARTGLYPSFKHGLAKLLWLRDQSPGLFEGAVWLSVADWIVFRLTGRMVTDPTLAVRTYAFNLLGGYWDDDTLREFEFGRDLFPDLLPSGAPAGGVSNGAATETGLPAGTPVAVAGHDHICTLLAAGVLAPGPVLDSMGTAESLIGVLERLEIGDREYESGLSFVPHVLPDRWCWLGGISSSGGAIEWLRERLGLSGSYQEVIDVLGEAGLEPTGILFFPYLSGSGAPRPDQSARAAFIGLSAEHGRADLLKAVIEGTTFEAENIRRAAEKLSGSRFTDLFVVGGGARNSVWMQVKADITGCTCFVPDLPEATALGAALTAGLGAGIFADTGAIATVAERARRNGAKLVPSARRHRVYRDQFESGYVPLQGPLRSFARRHASPE